MINRHTSVTTAEHFTAKPLPYSYNSVAPSISMATLTLHHDRHYEGYVATLNRLVEHTRFANMTLEEVVLTAGDGAIFNNAAQAWNHQFYFDQFSRYPQAEPTGALLDAIEDSFGTFCEMERRIVEQSLSLFGSGWLWLVVDHDNRLTLVAESNAGNPITQDLRPLLTIDLWEHAYYVDYENRRGDAVRAHLGAIDWGAVERRYRTM
ncbi:MAG: superoxide dismutase [Rikenellaceae bacterium]